MSEESGPGESVPTVAEVVESWKVPSDAPVALQIRHNILVAIEGGYDDPQLVADLAVGPLVVAVGRLETDLADARRRIAELERALADGESK
ncbi:hypothetical protein [Nocardia aurantia]|uniref:Uncharacterized protein n=1 Tax=Nocardia aurantia TaxID=2585199 RepID=A0A7K0DMY5_9NOCA|nr:hypothetical protein [Nocardia aurantia]MQY27110.1 hypothetical protein [Nocardia aurantia]